MNAAIESSTPALPTVAPAKTPTLEEALSSVLKLSPADRLEVIARLAQSLQAAEAAVPTVAPTASMLDFVGAWADMPGTDEEIMATIRQGRTFTRPEVSLY